MLRRRLILLVCLATAAWPQSYRVSTFAGGGSVRDGGPAVNAYLRLPEQIAYDKAANLYICDSLNHRVRIVSPDGNIRTFAGTGEPGTSGDGGPATGARLNTPKGIAIDASGAVWIGESGRIRQVQPSGNIRLIAAGNGLKSINALALHPDGSVYATDDQAHRVWRITADGTVTSVVGTGTPGYTGDGGPAGSAQVAFPESLAFDSQGALLIADYANSAVRKVLNGTITTLVGNGTATIPTSGQRPHGPVPFPSWVFVDAQGNLWVGSISLLRFPSGGTGPLEIVSTTQNYGFAGDGGRVAAAQFESIDSIVQAPDQSMVLADLGNHRIRRISPLGTVTTIVGADRTGFQGPAMSASMNPRGLAVDAAGNLYIGHQDQASGAILQVKPDGRISRFAGSGSIRPVQNGGDASIAGIKPRGLAVAPDNSVLYAESDSIDRQTVRRVREGRVESVAGKVKTSNNANLIVRGNTGDGGPGESALLNDPYGTWADRNGVVYVADTGNHRVRKVEGANISAFAGNGSDGSSGDGALALQAAMRTPTSVVGDRRGNVYIADFADSRIRRVTPAGQISTFAGTGSHVASGDGGPAAQAGVPFPYYITVDAQDNLYVTSAGRVRKIDGNSTITTIAGGGTPGGAEEGPGLEAYFTTLDGIAVAADGRVFVADIDRVRVLTPVAGGGGGSGGATGTKALAVNGAANNQSGSLGSVLPRPLSVRYTDNGQPVAGGCAT